MKKIKYLVVLFSLLLVPVYNVNASSASISCSSAGTVTVGNKITVTFTGNYSGDNRDMLIWRAGSIEWTSSNLNADFTPSAVAEDSTLSKSYTFTATNVGTATVRLVNVDVSDGDQLIGPAGVSNSCTINVVAPEPSSDSNVSSSNSSSTSSNDDVVGKNSDNSLKSLSIEGADLIPKFDKDTLEYNVELSNDTKKIKINAEVNDDKSSISGIGEREVKEGQNKIEIVVTAENGATRTYVINAYVKEKDPVIIKISSKNYTVLRKLDGIKMPKNFELSKIKIDKDEVQSYYNKKLNLNLVALKNDVGDINLYIYDNDSYTIYSTISSNDLELIIVELDKNTKVPNNYKKTSFKYNDIEVQGYAFKENSDFKLIYAVNVEDGKKGFYTYDIKQKTLQRYYDDSMESYDDIVEKCKLAFLVIGVFIVFLIIIIISLLSKNVKFKTKYLNSRLNPIDNPKYNGRDIQYQDLEGTRMMNKIDIDNKKQKKKNKKTFLDE